jgi:NAD(P)-dependent dehydrogenase (short-subunit alcohol dehydrogenase family)
MTSVSIDLTGTAVLVTGGARGVGRGITEAFLAAGADVMICGRHAPDDPVAHEGRVAGFVTADVREPDQVEAMVAATTQGLGRLDVVVNNAGGSPYADAATASPRFSTAIIALNLIAPLLVAQRANGVMQTQDAGGCIINVSSLSGMRPSPGTAAYGAAKAGLINLTQSLAIEWAPAVRVNCVSAGAVLTEQAHLHYGDAAGVAAVGAQIPLGRLASPADVAGACLFLASPMASYVSGANLVVHGGGERPPHLGAAANVDQTR